MFVVTVVVVMVLQAVVIDEGGVTVCVVTVVVVMVLQAVVIDEGGVTVCCYCSGGDGAAGSGNR